MSRKLIVIAGLILLAGLSRLIPHPYNFTAIGAMALFGGAVIKPRSLAFLIPMAAMFLTDLLIGFHANMTAVYLSFALMAIIGMTVVSKRSVGRIITGSLLSSLLFFLITNLAVWFVNPAYPQDLNGLMMSYAMALPFYESSIFGNLALNSIMGNLFYSGILFTAYAWLESKLPEPICQRA